MTDEKPKANLNTPKNVTQDFWAGLASDLLGYTAKLLIMFLIGTGGVAIACLYYGLPLAFSLIGGIGILGFAFALEAF